MHSDRLELLARVAYWYYEEGLSQEEIAARIGRSRSMISRMLQEARDQGLVEIRVHYPLKTDDEMEKHLQEIFGLSKAWVLATPPGDYETLLRRLGELGARSLQGQLRDGVRIGVGWGTALYEVVRAMPTLQLHDAQVVQIIGSAGYGDPMVDGPELARWLAQKLGAAYRFLHAPLIVEDERVAQALLQERTVAQTLNLARQVDVAAVGIGTVYSSLSSLRRAGYVGEEDLVSLREAGAVGDLIARQLDANGSAVDYPHHQVVGIDLQTLRSIPTVIGVAGGIVKAPAILAALRGGYLDVLVIDAATATQVVTLHHYDLSGDRRYATSSQSSRSS